jgi:hypothetical protein
MTTKGSLVLSSCFALALAVSASVPAQAAPPKCWEICTPYTPCDENCWYVTWQDTCADYGVCDYGGFAAQGKTSAPNAILSPAANPEGSRVIFIEPPHAGPSAGHPE